MSADEPPTMSRTLPGSTMNRRRVAFQYANCSAFSFSQTCFVSPGFRETRLKPFNSFCGLPTFESGWLTYICTTSSPARAPVFFTYTSTPASPSADMYVDARRFEYSKVVYERPWPNG